MSESPFLGFAEPAENWSKLPHALVEGLGRIESLSELKVILYILRHTWGYHDDQKRITLDEFANGRKRANGTRLDKGTGMSVNAIRAGLARAEKDGFIAVETDGRDKARVSKTYSLAINCCQSGYQELTPGVSEVDTRSEKETVDTNSGEETEKEITAPQAAENSDVPAAVPEPPAALPADAAWLAVSRIVQTDDEPGLTEAEPLPSDPLLHALQFQKRQADNWAVPAAAGGADDYAGAPLAAFCELIGASSDSLPPKQRRAWAKPLRELGEAWAVPPPLLASIIHAMPGSDIGWKVKGYSTPYAQGFRSDLEGMIAKATSGGLDLLADGRQIIRVGR